MHLLSTDCCYWKYGFEEETATEKWVHCTACSSVISSYLESPKSARLYLPDVIISNCSPPCWYKFVISVYSRCSVLTNTIQFIPRLLVGSRTKVKVLTMADIEREYLLVRAKLSLIQREPSLSTQLASESHIWYSCVIQHQCHHASYWDFVNTVLDWFPRLNSIHPWRVFAG